MGYKKKVTKGTMVENNKHTVTLIGGSDGENVVWLYDKLDRSGRFAFDLIRPEFKHREYLEKMINYSSMTWGDVKKQTHDKGKSKHHYISPEKCRKMPKLGFGNCHVLLNVKILFSHLRLTIY